MMKQPKLSSKVIKRTFIAAYLSVLALCSCIASFSAYKFLSAGRLECNKEVDFGTVFQHQKFKHSFKLKNKFNSTILITNIVKGCECTKARISATVLKPGEEANLDVEWDSGVNRGDADTTILAYFVNNHKTTVIDFHIKAHVLGDFYCKDSTIEFRGGVSELKFVDFKPGLKEDFELISVASNHRAFTAYVVLPGKRRIAIDFDHKLWIGHADPVLEIRTNSLADPVCYIKVRVN